MDVKREIEYLKSEATRISWSPHELPDINLQIPPTVYPPREDTSLLDQVVAEIPFKPGQKVLEIGCGSGAISISSRLRGWEVFCCDTNPYAVSATLGNASLNGIKWSGENVIEGGPGDDYFAQISEDNFDLIIWNLPYLDTPPEKSPRLGPLEESGLIENNQCQELISLLEQRPGLLNKKGVVLLLHSSNQLGHLIPKLWRSGGWATRPVAWTNIGDEKLTVIACWRPFEEAIKIHLEKCESTNSVAMELENAPTGSLVTTSHQTKGRGFSGNNWDNPKEGFMGSWVFGRKSIEKGAEWLQIASSVAVIDSISTALMEGLPSHCWTNSSILEDMGVRIKWPNDIWYIGRAGLGKMAGTLVEGKTQGEDVRVVIGIGFNKIPPNGKCFEGWNSITDIHSDLMAIILNASIASIIEEQPKLPPIEIERIYSVAYSAMRCSLCETRSLFYGLSSKGNIISDTGIIDTTTGGRRWEWV
ncbi:MAG: hypothetical protein CMB37_06460 [Euryarchaeota archaeon]|nr:hypothetical protein [Euryarchaeota archaeon]